MKKKIKDLTLLECKAICCDNDNECSTCPLWFAGNSLCYKDLKTKEEKEVEVDENEDENEKKVLSEMYEAREKLIKEWDLLEKEYDLFDKEWKKGKDLKI